jgi:hypothetical protein
VCKHDRETHRSFTRRGVGILVDWTTNQREPELLTNFVHGIALCIAVFTQNFEANLRVRRGWRQGEIGADIARKLKGKRKIRG